MRPSPRCSSPDALANWGWRIPFVLGLFVGLAGFFLRRSVEQTHQAPIIPSSRSPLAETLRHHGPLVAKLAGFAVFNSVSFYLVFLYVASWLQTVDGIAPAHALGINTLAMVLLLPVMLAAGWLSDRVGRKGLLLAAIALGFVAAVPLFELMLHDNLTSGLAGQFGMVLLIGAAAWHPARLHGRSDAPCRALHDDRARLQHDLRHRRRIDAAGRDLAGPSHGRRSQPRLHDHGRGGDLLRGGVDVQATTAGTAFARAILIVSQQGTASSDASRQEACCRRQPRPPQPA